MAGASRRSCSERDRASQNTDSNTQLIMGVEDNEHHRRKNASRYETLGSRNLMEQVTSARAKVDMYFGKVFLKLVDNLDLD